MGYQDGQKTASKKTEEKQPVVVEPSACSRVCFEPSCACRVRQIAGCSLPIASPDEMEEYRRTLVI